MEFKYIDELIDNLIIDLNVLRKTTESYSCLLYQHLGDFFADGNRLGNTQNTETLFNNLFIKSLNENVDLFLTPEYSCPINSIINVITNNKLWPNEKKLWVVGSESMKIEDLNSVLELNGGNIVIEYDETIDDQSTENLDPIFYIFKAKRNEKECLVVLIQFKTQHMGVWTSSLERDNILQGSQIFVLRNSPHSINLFTLICSEALEFQNSMNPEKIAYLSFDEKPTIILHPQMNPKPRDFGFIGFRNYLMRFERKELISLNWNCESTINTHSFTDKISRSGITFKGNEVDFSENTIKSNFDLDLHLFHNKKNRFYFIIGNNDQLTLLRNQALLAQPGANPALYRKNGPIVVSKFIYNHETNNFETDLDSKNNYIQILNELASTNSYISSPEVSFLDKERICVLSSMFIEKPTHDYFKTSKLDSLIMDENQELIKRISLIEMRCSGSREVITKFVTSLNELEVLINTNSQIPSTLVNLKNKQSHIGFDTSDNSINYLNNVVGQDGKSQKATITFQSQNISVKEAKKMYKQLNDLFEKDSPSKRRVVLFYKQGTEYKSEIYRNPPSIIDPIEESPVQIDKL